MALSPGKHGIIVVHGKATVLERGEQIVKVSNAIAETFRESPVSVVPVWKEKTNYVKGDIVRLGTGQNLECVNGGESSSSEPQVKKNGPGLVDDGIVQWKISLDPRIMRNPTIGIETEVNLNPSKVTLTITAPDIPDWHADTSYAEGEYVKVKKTDGLVFRHCFKCMKAGKPGKTAPAWPDKMDNMVLDGEILWQAFLALADDVKELHKYNSGAEYYKGDFVWTDNDIEKKPSKQGFELRLKCIKPGHSTVDNNNLDKPTWKNENRGLWSPRPWPEKESTWVFKEAYWNDAFPSPPAQEVALWALPILGDFLKHIFLRPLQRVLRILKDPTDRNYRDKPGATKPEVQEKKRADAQGKLETEGAGNQMLLSINLVIWCILLGVSLFFYRIVTVFYLALTYTPFSGWILDKLKIAPFMAGIDKELSLSFGDVQRYVEHGVWADAARNRLENVLIDMLGLGDRQSDDENVDDITIIAESGGAILAYDALRKDSDVANAIKHSGKANSGKRITLVTLASALNLITQLAQKSNLYAQNEFRQPLAEEITGHDAGKRTNFFWVDIHARLDLIPAGSVDPVLLKQARIDENTQFKGREVVSLDDFFGDHTYYWSNRELVTPRVIAAINGDNEYPWDEISPETKRDTHYKRLRDFNETAIVALLLEILIIASWFIFHWQWQFLLMGGLIVWGIRTLIHARLFRGAV